jgi:uncharacterized membrane protein YjjP (DUF1212 family)
MIMEQAHENKMTRDETLKVALMVGKILLKSGAETYRVEDTINRFCIANGYEVVSDCIKFPGELGDVFAH